jgi:hypothetical protein
MDQQPDSTADSVEGTIARRRRVMRKAVLIGVPMILTLHSRAFAADANDSVTVSERISRAPTA